MRRLEFTCKISGKLVKKIKGCKTDSNDQDCFICKIISVTLYILTTEMTGLPHPKRLLASLFGSFWSLFWLFRATSGLGVSENIVCGSMIPTYVCLLRNYSSMDIPLTEEPNHIGPGFLLGWFFRYIQGAQTDVDTKYHMATNGHVFLATKALVSAAHFVWARARAALKSSGMSASAPKVY